MGSGSLDERGSGRAELFPVTLREARRYVAEHHRHNEPPHKHRFSIGLRDETGLIGMVIADDPVARMAARDPLTIELTRLTTTGSRNACSRLYGAACRAAQAMGYRRVITYTLADEPGTSLRAAGFREDARSAGGSWSRGGHGSSRGVASGDRMRLFDPPKMPTGPKTRWVRDLNVHAAIPSKESPDA